MLITCIRNVNEIPECSEHLSDEVISRATDFVGLLKEDERLNNARVYPIGEAVEISWPAAPKFTRVVISDDFAICTIGQSIEEWDPRDNSQQSAMAEKIVGIVCQKICSII